MSSTNSRRQEGTLCGGQPVEAVKSNVVYVSHLSDELPEHEHLQIVNDTACE